MAEQEPFLADQSEALVLRHHTGLPESQIASAMGISIGAVSSHAAGR
jgi:DNA-directed RNA polymerase specialized sigma24 family protein